MRASLAALALTLVAAAAAPEDLAVIVNLRNPVQELSSAELREILRCERQHWRRSGRIYLLLPASGSAEKRLLLRRALGMNEDQLHRLYLGKLYSGEISAFPRVVGSGAAARGVVARAEHAIAVVPASAVDGEVRVLRIQGRRPGEAGYLLGSP
jgi:hypothetical protein